MQGMSTDAHFDRFGLNETWPPSQNLAVDHQHLDSLQPYIGMTLDYPLNLNTAHPANLQARLGYAYETLDATHDVSVSSTDGTRFVIPGTTDTRRILSAGLGVNVSVAKATNAYLRYDAVFHIGNLSAQSIQEIGRASWRERGGQYGVYLVDRGEIN